MHHSVAFASLFLVIAGVTGSSSPARGAIAVPDHFYSQVIRPRLEEPNSFAFLPDGRVLVTEQRTGYVRLIVNYDFGRTDPVLAVPDLDPFGYEHGMQGVTVDPGWPARPYVYLFYDRVGGFNRLVRYTAVGDLDDPAGDSLLLQEPRLLIDDIPDLTPSHNSGCLRFGPDGLLYVSLGDDFDYWCDAADRTSLRGQILRLDVSLVPPGPGPQVPRSMIDPGDNPWSTSTDENERLVFAYGMRNPWRFNIDPVTGVLYGADVGDQTFEEMNEIHAGDFLGWPWREAYLSRTPEGCPEPGGVGAVPFVPPIAYFDHQPDTLLHAIVPAGMYRPVAGAEANWPADYYPDRGDVFYMDYFVGALKRITWDGSSWVPAAAVPGQPTPSSWGTGFTSGVDFQVGPDGSLWWLRQFDDDYDFASGSLNRIRYSAVLAADPPDANASSLHAVPNPAHGAMTISFVQPRPGHARVTVYGVRGRRLRVLSDGWLPAGTHRLAWDGLDASGGPAPAGVYYVRLEREGAPPASVRALQLR